MAKSAGKGPKWFTYKNVLYIYMFQGVIYGGMAFAQLFELSGMLEDALGGDGKTFASMSDSGKLYIGTSVAQIIATLMMQYTVSTLSESGQYNCVLMFVPFHLVQLGIIAYYKDVVSSDSTITYVGTAAGSLLLLLYTLFMAGNPTPPLAKNSSNSRLTNTLYFHAANRLFFALMWLFDPASLLGHFGVSYKDVGVIAQCNRLLGNGILLMAMWLVVAARSSESDQKKMLEMCKLECLVWLVFFMTFGGWTMVAAKAVDMYKTQFAFIQFFFFLSWWAISPATLLTWIMRYGFFLGTTTAFHMMFAPSNWSALTDISFSNTEYYYFSAPILLSASAGMYVLCGADDFDKKKVVQYAWIGTTAVYIPYALMANAFQTQIWPTIIFFVACLYACYPERFEFLNVAKRFTSSSGTMKMATSPKSRKRSATPKRK